MATSITAKLGIQAFEKVLEQWLQVHFSLLNRNWCQLEAIQKEVACTRVGCDSCDRSHGNDCHLAVFDRRHIFSMWATSRIGWPTRGAAWRGSWIVKVVPSLAVDVTTI